MMNGSGIYDYLRNNIWEECARTDILLHNAIIKQEDKKSPYALLYGYKCKLLKELHVFGESGMVKTNYDTINSKLWCLLDIT